MGKQHKDPVKRCVKLDIKQPREDRVYVCPVCVYVQEMRFDVRLLERVPYE